MTDNKQIHLFYRVLVRSTVKTVKVGLLINTLLITLILALGRLADASPRDETPTEGQRVQHLAEVKQGTLLFKDDVHYVTAPVLHTDVEINVVGMLARAVVRQSFKNPDTQWKEGVYVFPLPEEAAVDHMRVHIGERVIEGRVKERDEAKKTYRKAKNAGKKASLVEQERANIFTTSVANIGPRETIVVEIEYQEIVSYDAGLFRLRFPMVVAPRYIPGETITLGFAGTGWALNTDQVADAQRVTPPVSPPKREKLNPVSIKVNLSSGFALANIASPYHPITSTPLSQTEYRVELTGKRVPADRDFVLTWAPHTGEQPKAAFFKQTKAGNDYGLLMLLPPQRDEKLTLTKEMIFVIDTSGSMEGASITQARAALQTALERLHSGDRFNVIQFNSTTSQLFPSPRPVSPGALQEARHYIDHLQAQGGTEMAPALTAALMNQTGNYDVRQVIFLTDGSVGNEDDLFRIMEQRLQDSRLFTIGIGSAPNSYFMSRAADFGRGTHTHIGKLSEVQEKMDRLFQKLESPVLSDIQISWPKNTNVESWPARIPDLYLGEPLLISIKAKALPGQIGINGRSANKDWQANVNLDGGAQRNSVAVLWARRKIAALTRQQRLRDEADSIKSQIIETALTHHLVSKYTSLVAVDVTPARKPGQPLHGTALPTNLPAGWQYGKVFGVLPGTATPANWYLLMGMAFLILSFIMTLIFRKNETCI